MGFQVMGFQGITVEDQLVGFRDKACIPFSQRCRRRLPSLPLSRASRRFKLSRRRGSRRRKLTVGGRDSPEPRTLTCDEGAGVWSSIGMVSDTVVPRRLEREGVEIGSALVVVDSERDKSCNEAAACSVHAEMAMVCCGDRLPWEAAGRSLGCIAMLELVRGGINKFK